MNRIRFHDPVEIVKEAGKIVQKEILASPDFEFLASDWTRTADQLV